MSTNETIITVMTLLLITTAGVARADTLSVGSGPGYDFNAIQAAIDAASSGDTIVVAQGTYNENICFDGKDIILTSTDPDDPNVIVATVIQGDGTTPAVTIANNKKSCNIQLIGFTITAGNADGSGSNGSGGGMYNDDSDPTVAN